MAVVSFPSNSRLPEFRESKPIEELEHSEIVAWAANALSDLVNAAVQSRGALDERLIFARLATICALVAYSKPQFDEEWAGCVVQSLVTEKFRQSRHEI
jgi:hypothetical protein